MFEIGASELFLVAIVALIVLGPERLPKAARFVGLWVRRARAQWYSVRSELERELAAEELQRTVRESRDSMNDIASEIRSADADMRREFDALRGDVERTSGAGDQTPADGTMLPLDVSQQHGSASQQEAPPYDPPPLSASTQDGSTQHAPTQTVASETQEAADVGR
jgi:sec-independent protein translocase protein TatB